MARLAPQFKQPDELSEADISAIVEIGREQAALMDRMEAAIEADDAPRVLELARRLVGLEQQVREQ
jgi:hypothetical protein